LKIKCNQKLANGRYSKTHQKLFQKILVSSDLNILLFAIVRYTFDLLCSLCFIFLWSEFQDPPHVTYHLLTSDQCENWKCCSCKRK